MNINELTDMLVTSSQQYNQAKFHPWWEGNHEEAIYRYSIFPGRLCRMPGSVWRDAKRKRCFHRWAMRE